MKAIKQRWQTIVRMRSFMIGFGLVALIMAYVFASLAINSGSLLDYAIAILFVIIGVRELFAGLFKKREHHQL